MSESVVDLVLRKMPLTVGIFQIHDTASMSSESTISGPVGYDQLTRNRNYHTNQDWVGLGQYQNNTLRDI